MTQGRIKWYNEKKGYGFITTDEGGELFIHRSGIKEYGHFGLQEGDQVSFDIKTTAKGKQATNLRPVKSV